MTKTKKIIDLVLKISWWVVFTLLFLLAISIVSAKVKGEVPKVFGYSVIKITTPSMQKTIPVNSYILIKETEPKDIKEQDIICFYSEDKKIYGYPNTHRVVSVIESNGEYEYVTKGDSNAIEDSVNAKGENLIGKYIKTLDGVTFISNTIQSKDMAIVFVIMFITSLAIVIASVIIKPNKETKNQSKE
jgi:signal peptidase I